MRATVCSDGLTSKAVYRDDVEAASVVGFDRIGAGVADRDIDGWMLPVVRDDGIEPGARDRPSGDRAIWCGPLVDRHHNMSLFQAPTGALDDVGASVSD
jgi:hypothetical protein